MRLKVLDSGHAFFKKLVMGTVALATRERVVDMMKIIMYRADFFGRAAGVYEQSVMRGKSEWTPAERELFAAWVSEKNRCRFCMTAHQAVAAMGIGREKVNAVFSDLQTADVSDKAKLMLVFLGKLAISPEEITAADVLPLRMAGISDEAIRDGIYVCGDFSTFNRLAFAFDCEVPTPAQAAVIGNILWKLGYNMPINR